MEPDRVNVICTLQLIAEPKDQAEYQRQVPGVNVAAELVNQWFCDFYHPGAASFEAAFSPSELAAMAEFNRFYDSRVSQLPKKLSEMLESPSWLEVVAAAGEVLRVNGWSQVVARYEG